MIQLRAGGEYCWLSCFVVLGSHTNGQLLGLLDDYGRCHLVHIAAGAGLGAEVGSRLHGPRAAVGRHFLVSVQTGARLRADFELVGVSRQAVLDRLHPDLCDVALPGYLPAKLRPPGTPTAA